MYQRAILVRLQSEIHEILKVVAKARGEHVSSFVRQAIMEELARLGFLDNQQCKALGITARLAETSVYEDHLGA